MLNWLRTIHATFNVLRGTGYFEGIIKTQNIILRFKRIHSYTFAHRHHERLIIQTGYMKADIYRNKDNDE